MSETKNVFIKWFIKNEYGVLNTTKLHVASEAWSAGFKAAQQSRASDGLKSSAKKRVGKFKPFAKRRAGKFRR